MAMSSTDSKQHNFCQTLLTNTAAMHRYNQGQKGCAAKQSNTSNVFYLFSTSVRPTSSRGCRIAERGQSNPLTFFYKLGSWRPKKAIIFLEELGQSSKIGLNQLMRKQSEIQNAAMASSLNNLTKGCTSPGSHWLAKSGYSLTKAETMKDTCLSTECYGSSGQGFVNSTKC